MLSGLLIIHILTAILASWIRMAVALILSIMFSIIVGVAAAVNQYAEKILIPVLDVLQSVPVLSFFPLALYAFAGLHPMIGPEFAAIFLIFTSQTWNIAFGVYEGVKLLPRDIFDVSRSLGFGPIHRFLTLYLPASFPKITTNIPASWSNGLYFLVACEIISMGEREIKLFGIGSLFADFIAAGRYLEFWTGIMLVIAAVILTNVLIFIPLMRLSERYKFEAYVSEVPRVWLEKIMKPFGETVRGAFFEALIPGYEKISSAAVFLVEHIKEYKIHISIVSLMAGLAFLLYYFQSMNYLFASLSLVEGFRRLGLLKPLTMIGFSLLRVAAAIFIGISWSLPLSILIYEKRGIEPFLIPFLQVFASLPSSLLVPFIMRSVSDLGLPMEIGGVIIIVLGIQWYLFFFLYSAIRNIPREEREVCELLRMKGVSKLRHLYLPRSFPSLVMGCMVAMGGGWNTLIIAERLTIDDQVWEVENPGIGKAISTAVSAGNVSILAALTIWMVGFIVILNRFFWRRMYEKAAEGIRG